MRLIELLSVISDEQEVVVRCDNGDYVLDTIAVYNGKDSIPTEYNEAWVNEVYEYGGAISIVVDLER